MIIVHGTMPIKPDCRDQALSLAREMSIATQAEDGCISYDFYVGLSDPNTLVLLQEWESMEALSAHFRTRHLREFLRELPNVVAGAIVTRRYAVRGTISGNDALADDEPDDLPEHPPAPPIIH